MSRTALIVAVAEAETLVNPWRQRYTPDGPLGVPAHITVLFPFLSPERIDREREDLGELFRSFPSFGFSLAAVARFPSIVYLAPDPAEPFVAMTRAVVERYPEYQPYGGEFRVDEIVPHLTVVDGELALHDEIEAALAPALPIHASAREVTLIEELPDGRWLTRETLPLGMA